VQLLLPFGGGAKQVLHSLLSSKHPGLHTPRDWQSMVGASTQPLAAQYGGQGRRTHHPGAASVCPTI